MNSVIKDFMESTKYENMGDSDQEKGLPQPPLELGFDSAHKLIKLPDYKSGTGKSISVLDAINERKSLRVYSDKPLTMEELSLLLWCTQGVKNVVKNKATFRNVPSAGARHAFETYILVNSIDGLKPGLYRYISLQHSILETNTDEDIADRVTAACGGQEFVKKSAATFIWTAVPYRMNWRYSERGYRYLHLDAGHVCQNLYLAAETIDCGVCAIAAYNDNELNELLGIDGENQFAIYIGTVGKK